MCNACVHTSASHYVARCGMRVSRPPMALYRGPWTTPLQYWHTMQMPSQLKTILIKLLECSYKIKGRSFVEPLLPGKVTFMNIFRYAFCYRPKFQNTYFSILYTYIYGRLYRLQYNHISFYKLRYTPRRLLSCMIFRCFSLTPCELYISHIVSKDIALDKNTQTLRITQRNANCNDTFSASTNS